MLGLVNYISPWYVLTGSTKMANVVSYVHSVSVYKVVCKNDLNENSQGSILRTEQNNGPLVREFVQKFSTTGYSVLDVFVQRLP